MKLKDDDILQVGDVVHLNERAQKTKQEIIKDSTWLLSKTVGGLKTSLADIGYTSVVIKVTRKSTRVSRKEYKRRIKAAISEIENADNFCMVGFAPILVLDTEKLMKILRGEE